ncbi:class I SAM-dependent methyltransferase [Streptomyces sp. AA0539]|uniref:class I SAM-dependent methyltransferase n=1 Tax=Streptomyces sp. AA0539 TaxID=1210045 RepID=UPI00031AF659|nr:class I SAM-dependent methyltransferase [Streptomyces sp. AA0539]
MTEDSGAATVSAAYTEISDRYVEFVREVFPRQPLELGLLGVFAELVRGTGPVADIGCGPGHVTAHLDGLGVETFGIDLTPRMIELARAAYPGLRFTTGSMLDLRLPDRSVAGVLGWYSLIHLPPERVPVALAEFHRVLVPGGRLLLGFQTIPDGTGGEPVPFDHKVTPGWLWPLETMADALVRAGFTLSTRVRRAPEPDERRHQGYLLAVSADRTAPGTPR